MIVNIDIHEYQGQGMRLEWDDGHKIWTKLSNDRDIVSIEANRAGLVSLARHLLTLAQDKVPSGYHIHLDDENSLEDGSCQVVLMRIDD